MTEFQNGVCDLCGDDHSACSCPMLSQLDSPAKLMEDTEPHLAYQSLPSWVKVEDGPDGLRLVVINQSLPKFTRLGPFIAPHKPHLSPATDFPLKICHAGGSHTYLDQSRKWLCNWLSLVPIGSPSNRNLLACQVEDLIYYIAAEEIQEGSELLVWYAPFYQQKVKEELKTLGFSQNVVSTPIDTHRNPLKQSLPTFPSGAQLHISHSLSRIVVGRGQVTFTHNSWEGESGNQFFGHPAKTSGHIMVDKCHSGEIVQGTQIQSTSACGYTHEDNNQKVKKDQFSSRDIIGYVSQLETNTAESIQLVNSRENLREPECIVTFTITAASENYDLDLSHSEHYANDDLQSESCSNGNDACEESTQGSNRKDSPFPLATPKRKSYKLREPKSEICVAGSDVVKQLPARALGAREPRPWSCKYCGDNFTKLLTFATHLKAHLLWIVGRCHVCKECGGSFSSSVHLHRHQQAAHQQITFQSESDCRGESEVLVKHEVLSEDEDAVDDPGGKESKEGLKRISALPTKHVEGPHECQICTKHFHKAQYLLRHLRKHTGDFTCQYCLKVFARKESLQKHTCPEGGQQKSLKCLLCGRSFLNPDLLEHHYLKHKENKKCTRCSRSFSNMVSLERHVKTCPSVKVSLFFQCNICGKDFISEKLLERHIASHSRQYQCDLCSKPYSNSTNLAHHVPLCRQSRQVAAIGHVSCEDCGKEFTDASAFRAHYHTHTHPFHCSCCNHRFRTRVGYEVHVCEVEQHCDQCSGVFRSMQALKRHYSVHGPPPYTCSSCRRSYYRKESLDRHVCSFEAEFKENPKNKETGNFTCNVCSAPLATKHSLNTHMRAAHGGLAARELNCEICGKQFHRKDLLREHQSVHAPPSFPCPTCKKLFKTRKSLEVHSLLHLGIKRFTCKYCNKKFHQKVNLTRHERSHMPRGAVKCQYCGTHCLSTDDLKAHLLSHTLLQPDLSHEDKQQDEHSKFAAEKEAVHDEGLHTYSRDEEVTNGTSHELRNEFIPHVGGEPKLKILSTTEDGLQTQERIFSGPNSVIDAEQSLGSASRGMEITVKGRLEAGVTADFKHGLSSGFRTELVHNVVPVITSDLDVQPEPISHSETNNHSTVFIPQRISNICLSTNQQSLSGTYLVPSHSETISSSNVPQNLCSSGVLSETNNSLNSEVCRLSSNVLLETPSAACVSEKTDHINSNKNCQMAVGRNQERQFVSNGLVHISDGISKDDHLRLGSSPALAEQVCVYESNSNSVPVSNATAQPLDCHVLSNEQIVENVVLLSDPHSTDC